MLTFCWVRQVDFTPDDDDGVDPQLPDGDEGDDEPVEDFDIDEDDPPGDEAWGRSKQERRLLIKGWWWQERNLVTCINGI